MGRIAFVIPIILLTASIFVTGYRKSEGRFALNQIGQYARLGWADMEVWTWIVAGVFVVIGGIFSAWTKREANAESFRHLVYDKVRRVRFKAAGLPFTESVDP